MRLRLFIILLIITTGGCSQEKNEEHPEWQTYEENGVTARMPDGWNLHTEETGVIRSMGPAGDELIVWPFFIPGILSPQAYHHIFQTLSERVYPNARWGNVQDTGSGMLKRSGSREDKLISASIVLSGQNNRTGGMLYIVSAPQDVYRENEEIYAGILNNMRIRGPVASDEFTDRPAIRYTDFNDPREGAFKVKVPQGWNVSGAADRYAAVDVRKWIRAADPSGGVYIFSGDTNIPTFTVPNEMLTWTGFTEGSWYSPGYGVNMLVSRYYPGARYAHQYLSQGGIPDCRDVSIIDSRDRPDIVEQANQLAARYGLAGYRFNAGEVRFTCKAGGVDRSGYISAVTLYIDTFGSGALWGVESISGYVAVPDKEIMAEEAYETMIRSYEVNPVWHRQQQQLSANVSAIVSETSSQISDIISQSYDRRSRSQDEILRKYSNYLRGVEDVRDPQYGTEHRVWSGSNYYWLDNTGAILGTDLHVNPDVMRFREMIRLD